MAIAAFLHEKTLRSDAQTFGFVFPIYDFKAPKVVTDFVSKFQDLGSKYLFAVCTYGVAPFHSLTRFNQTLLRLGNTLAAGFSVRMPHNAIGSKIFSEKDYEFFFHNWKIKRENIAQVIRNRQKNKLEEDNLFTFGKKFFYKATIFKMLPTLTRLLKQAMLHGWESLGFQTNDQCKGCGICEKVCPMQNIAIVDSKPSWLDHCASCFACVQWCPNQAIGFGKLDLNLRNYHHPEVKLSDILITR